MHLSAQTHYQAELDAGRFCIQHCPQCQHHVFTPRELCPHCGAGGLRWVRPSGLGTVYSTSTIARKVWSELPNHRLKTVCNHLNYRFWHHHPLEDARACAHIVRTAMRVTGWNSHALRDAFGRVRRRAGQYG